MRASGERRRARGPGGRPPRAAASSTGLGEFAGDDGAARAGADHDHFGKLFDVARPLRFGVHRAILAAPSSGTRSSDPAADRVQHFQRRRHA
jgi:hypothetical protein